MGSGSFETILEDQLGRGDAKLFYDRGEQLEGPDVVALICDSRRLLLINLAPVQLRLMSRNAIESDPSK